MAPIPCPINPTSVGCCRTVATDSCSKRNLAVSASRSRPASPSATPTPSPPSITDLTAFPSIISPNFDGQDDAVALTYRLDKRARINVFATDAQGRRVYAGPREPREPGEYRDTWDGLDGKRQPLPDGAYLLVVQATDAAGNVSLSRAPVALRSGGRPAARLIDVRFAPRQLTSGGLLHITMLVRNTGTSLLRTQGPEPGFVYSSYDTYASILGRQFVDRAGVWRVGVDWAGSPGGALASTPIAGALAATSRPVRRSPSPATSGSSTARCRTAASAAPTTGSTSTPAYSRRIWRCSTTRSAAPGSSSPTECLLHAASDRGPDRAAC